MGRSIGGEVPVKYPIKSIKIELHWHDAFSKGSKDFEDVHQFADFLKSNPLLAEAVGYVKKKS